MKKIKEIYEIKAYYKYNLTFDELIDLQKKFKPISTKGRLLENMDKSDTSILDILFIEVETIENLNRITEILLDTPIYKIETRKKIIAEQTLKKKFAKENA